MEDRISTGIKGLDEILNGGLLPARSYLVQGGPGAGKSTFAYHFLEDGNRKGEKTLLITLGEGEDYILSNAERLNIDLSGTRILDLSPDSEFYKAGSYSVFSPADIEQGPMVQEVGEIIEDYQPDRVVLDSVTMLNMLNSDPYQVRNLALSFIRFVCDSGATLIMLSELYDKQDNTTFWVDGVLELSYHTEWRKAKVTKFRGSGYNAGEHSFTINDQGITVFPKLQPKKYKHQFEKKMLSSGIPGFDRMLSGGIERGTTSLFTGPSGVGKTNLGIQFIQEAARNGHRSAIYTFEESQELIISRSEGINIPLNDIIEDGNLKVASIEPLSYSPDEFSKIVRDDVEENDTRIVMIDAIGGYRLAVGEQDALTRLHSLCVYLQNMGVTTILVNESQNLFGTFSSTEINASYLADNILLLRYFEMGGSLRKSIGILKKRLSDFEKNIREFKITGEGIKLGEPLKNMRGILTGIPEYHTPNEQE